MNADRLEHEINLNRAFREKTQPLLDRLEKESAGQVNHGDVINGLRGEINSRMKSMEDRMHTLETGSVVRNPFAARPIGGDAAERLADANAEAQRLKDENDARRARGEAEVPVNTAKLTEREDLTLHTAGEKGVAGGLANPGKLAGPGGPVAGNADSAAALAGKPDANNTRR